MKLQNKTHSLSIQKEPKIAGFNTSKNVDNQIYLKKISKYDWNTDHLFQLLFSHSKSKSVLTTDQDKIPFIY